METIKDPIQECISQLTKKLELTDIEDLTSFKLHSPFAITSALSLKINQKKTVQELPKPLPKYKTPILQKKEIKQDVIMTDSFDDGLTDEDLLLFLQEEGKEGKEETDMILS